MLAWCKARIHPVFLIAAMAAGILAGCVLAVHVPSGLFTGWTWWLVWVVASVLCVWRSQRWMIVLVLCVGVGIGYGRGASELASWVDVSKMAGQTVTVSGVVKEDPAMGSGSEVRLRLGDVQVNKRAVGGVFWATVSGDAAAQIQRSDGVTVRGKIGEGFGTFAASMYRARVTQIDKQVAFDPMLGVRNSFANAIRKVLPDPQAALGIGYLLGQKRALPPDFEEALLTVGLTHVVVASGYNLTILVRLARRLFVKKSRYLSVLAAGSMVLAFIGVTGLSPSMTRAGFVAGLSLLTWYVGRTIHPMVLLLIAAAASVLVQPSYAWGDVGWLLSFASFAGVMFLAPLLQAYFFGDKQPGVLRQVVGETFSAQLVTLPIILLSFGLLSNVALLANVLVLPLVPLAMLLVFGAGMVSWIIPALAEIAAQPAYWVLTYMTRVIEWLADLPWARTEVKIDGWTVTLLYAGIVLVIVALRLRTGFAFRKVNLVE